jgi:saccharopine dehydrogenase (NAD+, L-glutamate forming)
MWHKFTYLLNNEMKEIHSSMVYIGKDQTYTAMSDTVGLPVAICAKLILNGTIKTKGVQIPILKEIYEPVMRELEDFGMKYIEKVVS